MPYKHEYDKILTRLTKILSRLNEGEKLSVKELAEEFNTSRRTIQRDFNERLSAFPLEKEKKKWKMKDGFCIEKSKSIEDEIVLDIIEKMTESIGGAFSTKAHKLLSKIKNEEFNPIYAKLNIEDISEKFSDIQILENAIKEKRVLEAIYDNERSKPYKTTLQPLKIANYEGFWYLITKTGDELRKYYLKNISQIKPKDEFFKVTQEIEDLLENSISIWFSKTAKPFEVTLYAESEIAKYFKRRALPTQKITSILENGDIELTLTITDEMEIIPIIQYWMPYLHIIEPQKIAEIVDKNILQYKQKREQL